MRYWNSARTLFGDDDRACDEDVRISLGVPRPTINNQARRAATCETNEFAQAQAIFRLRLPTKISECKQRYRRGYAKYYPVATRFANKGPFNRLGCMIPRFAISIDAGEVGDDLVIEEKKWPHLQAVLISDALFPATFKRHDIYRGALCVTEAYYA